MCPVYYYECYRDRFVEENITMFQQVRDPVLEDSLLRDAYQLDLNLRRERAISVATFAGIDQRNVIVEAYTDSLPEDGEYMRLLRAGGPAIIVMHSLSMYLQQSGMSYWISLLRKTLQCDLLPITLEEFLSGAHNGFHETLSWRRATIESLTSHIRPEPKRVRGRRKHGPTAEILGIILIESERRTVTSASSVLKRISSWHDECSKDTPEKFKQHPVFSDVRWGTYKYKIRKMARELLEETWKECYPAFPIEDDIWQASLLWDGKLVYPAAMAAAMILPEFGYEQIGHQWIKTARKPVVSND